MTLPQAIAKAKRIGAHFRSTGDRRSVCVVFDNTDPAVDHGEEPYFFATSADLDTYRLGCPIVWEELP